MLCNSVSFTQDSWFGSLLPNLVRLDVETGEQTAMKTVHLRENFWTWTKRWIDIRVLNGYLGSQS